jgi:serine/threonine protein kinase
MNENLLKFYASDILNSLATVHENNIIHCDVKPQNFLLFTQEMMNDSTNNDDILENSFTSYEEITEHTSILKLTDFGLSHIIPEKEKLAYARYTCGTHNYKAPELINVGFVIK